ncbi:MAG: tetratricopeptide repeat protein [Pyrinomonadaceae bacterium]
MKRCALFLVFLMCLFALAPAIHAAPAGENWTSVRSKNFQLIGNASEKEIRRVATRLEQFRFVFAGLFPKAKFDSPVPTTVVVFKNDSSYKPYKPLYNGKPAAVAGYFQPGPDVNYITLTAERYGEESPYATIFHEYVHLLIENTMSDAPVWFNEGLAEYYSTFDISDGDQKVTLGKPITNHVLRLREQFIRLPDLLSVDHRSSLYNERDKKSVFYAQSWALLHYLLQSNKGERIPQLGRFSELVGAGKPLEESFQQAFQTDFKTMEKELRNYVNKNSYTGHVFTSAKPLVFDAEMQAAPLSEAEARAYLGDLLLHINRLDDAEAHLQQALTLAPDLATAHASFGMLRVRQKRFADARESLRKAVAGNSQNYLAHYYYAYALSREGMDQNNFIRGYPHETAQTMRAELRKAIELAPQFAESYYLLGFINLVTGEELVETTPLLYKARSLAPGRHDFTFLLGQIYLRRQQYEAARKVLTALVNNNGVEEHMRAQAQSMLSTVTMMAAQASRLKEEGLELVTEPGGSAPRLKRRGQEPDANSTASAGTRSEPTVDAAGAQEALASAKILIPKRTDGTQLRARLARIECLSGGRAVFHVKVDNRVLKLHASNFGAIKFVSFAPNVGGEINCGARPAQELIIATYRPHTGTDAKPRDKFDGELIALDFIMPEMEIEP